MQALRPEDAVVATYREHGHALARGVPAGALMAEMFGKAKGCSRGRGGSMHLFDAARRFYGGNAIVGGGLPLAVGLALADQLLGRPPRDGLLLRRGRGGRGRVPRVAEPGGAVAAAGAVPAARTTSTRWAPRSSAPSRRPTSRSRRASYGIAARGRRRHGRARGGRGGRARGRRGRAAGRARASSSCAPTASARTRCTTPSSTATRTRSSAGRSATRSRALRGAAAATQGCSTTPICGDRGERRRRDRRRGRLRRGRHRWEPVEDLDRRT